MGEVKVNAEKWKLIYSWCEEWDIPNREYDRLITIIYDAIDEIRNDKDSQLTAANERVKMLGKLLGTILNHKHSQVSKRCGCDWCGMVRYIRAKAALPEKTEGDESDCPICHGKGKHLHGARTNCYCDKGRKLQGKTEGREG